MMEIKARPILNEDDYEAALAEVDALMDAAPGTHEGDRLDVLVALVEAYEARHWLIEAPGPIEATGLGWSSGTFDHATWSQ